MRGLRGALGFLVRSEVWSEVRLLGRAAEDSVGVVDTVMSLGRMVPAMMAGTRRCGAQWGGSRGSVRVWVRVRSGRCALRAAETATERATRFFESWERIAKAFGSVSRWQSDTARVAQAVS
jgi:hypothetical protein